MRRSYWRTVAAGSLVLMLSLASSTLAASRMVMSETEFNFGYVPQNSKITHLFWIKSAGQDRCSF